MSSKLHNSMLEITVVIGLDETTAMFPSDPQRDVNNIIDLYSVALSPQTLAVVSSRVALFPPVSPQPDHSYPPRLDRSRSAAVEVHPSNGKVSSRRPGVYGKKKQGENEDGGVAALKRRLTKRYSYRQVDFARDKATTVRPAELTLNAEMLTSLVTLCFPDECYVHRKKHEDVIQYMVLTDLVGCRTYAVSFTSYTKHYLYKDRDGSWRCNPLSDADDKDKDNLQRIAYVPRCYVIISQSPYFTVMKDCLSRLVHRLKEYTDDWRRLVKEFTLQLALTPAPPAGNVFMQFHLLDVTMTVPCPEFPGRLPLDFDVGIVFRCLDAQTVLLVVTALLTQQRILFVSSSFVLLTLVMESFVHFLFPFNWIFTYVPLLPLSLLELVEAPGTFMMGCHSNHRHMVEEVEGLVVVNLESGTVLRGPTVDIPCLPKNPTKIFKDGIRRIARPIELWRLERATTFSYEETRTAELQEQWKINHSISFIFLELMINLFRDVLLHITPEKRFFHKEQFLDAVGENDRPFYEQVLATDLFAMFLKDRLDKKQNVWTDIVNKSRPVARNSVVGGLGSLSHDNRPGSRLSRPSLYRNAISLTSLSLSSLSSISEPDNGYSDLAAWSTFKLPNFMYGLSHLYLDNCYQEVSSAITSCRPMSSELSSYVYLRGMISSARQKKLDALDDFCSLATVNHKLFPTEYVLELLTSMTEDEKSELELSQLLRSSSILRELKNLKTEDRSPTDQPVVMELNKIPEKDIDLRWFVQLLDMLQISSDVKTAGRLFHALTLDRSDVVDPTTFEEFYKCWKENELEILRAFPVADPFDCVLVISGFVKCSYGMGRVILTCNRLLFMQEGLSKIRTIFELKDIKSIEKLRQRSFFKEHLNLKIQSRAEKGRTFNVCLRDETHRWFLILHEMWAGKLLSEEMQDPEILDWSMQNVLIADAYIRSGEADFSSHYENALQMSPSLCYYMSKLKKSSKNDDDSLTNVSSKVLLKRIDPNISDNKRIAVEAVLYTKAYINNHYHMDMVDHADMVKTRLWCGMADGKIAVYEVETCQMAHLFLAKDKVTSFLQCGNGEVWTASFDGCVYVILNESNVTSGKVLQGHFDSKVTDLTMSIDSKFIFSSGLNGKIIVWSSVTKRKIKELNVTDKALQKILYYEDRLWCCTRDELLSVSLDGVIMGRLSFNETGSTQLSFLECFLITPQNELWVGLGRHGQVHVCDIESLKSKMTLDIPCRGVSAMMLVENKVWIGSKQGFIHIFDRSTYSLDNQIMAHKDSVQAMATGADLSVITGSGSADGRVAVWRWPGESSAA